MYYDRLLFFARRFVSLEVAEDILSESYIKLWTRIIEFDSLPAIEQWLRVTVRNACIDNLRKQKTVTGHEKAFQYLTDQQYEELYFRSSIEADLFEKITSAIDQLAPLTGKIIKLSFFDGLSVDEIAEKLKISHQVVYNKKSLGLKELRLKFLDNELVLICLLAASMGCKFQ